MASHVPYHEFQVATSSGYKWKADGEIHQNINLSMSVNQKEGWRFEREEDEPLWSFHILSDAGEKLYLSYDEQNDNITLELKNDSEGGKKRFFKILVENHDHYLFRAYNREDRYIGRTGDKGHLKLERFTTEQAPEGIKWLIKDDLTIVGTSTQKVVVGMQAKNEAKKWISSGAQESQPIKVKQKASNEKWNLTITGKGDNEKWQFSPCNNSTLFPSSVDRIDEILFEGLSRNSDARSYHVENVGSGHKLQNVASCELQNKASCKWLFVDPKSHLSQVKNEKHAVVWETPAYALPYEMSGKIQFYPLY